MFDFREEIKNQTPDDVTAIKGENDQLKNTIKDLTEKCQKLEKKAKEFERLIGEQNSLMKALNVKRKFYFLCAACLLSTVLLVYTYCEPF
jgi:flagellar motility protein MotE (MotC chaperone)